MIPCVKTPHPDSDLPGQDIEYTDAQLQTIRTAVDTLNAQRGTNYRMISFMETDGEFFVAGLVLAEEFTNAELTPAMCALIPTLVSDLNALLAPHGMHADNATVTAQPM